MNQLRSSARQRGPLDRPVAADSEVPLDDYGQYLILVTDEGRIEHFTYDDVTTTNGLAEPHAFLAELDALRDAVATSPWQPNSWIGLNGPGCFGEVPAPDDPMDLSCRPVMPDLAARSSR